MHNIHNLAERKNYELYTMSCTCVNSVVILSPEDVLIVTFIALTEGEESKWSVVPIPLLFTMEMLYTNYCQAK